MIDQKDVKQALSIDIDISPKMLNELTLWAEMYENSAEWLTGDIVSMNLPAAISSEIARSVTIEMQVTLGDSARAQYLAEQFEPIMDKIRQTVEYGCAKGGLILKPYVEDEEIPIDIIQADQFYPVNFDSSGNITAAVFVDQIRKGGKYFTRLEYHDTKYIEGEDESEPVYLVRNKAYRSDSREHIGTEVSLETVPDWADIADEAIIENVDHPLFAYFKYPMANNIDPDSPIGVSCYSRATDHIKEADEQWTRLMWEFESGERALYVDVMAFGKDEEGDPVLPNKRLYRTIETGSMEGDFFQDWSPDFREAQLMAGLDDILKKIEFNCGLAFGTLSDPQSIDKTATEIKMAKQRSAATIADTQKALRKALDELFQAMNTWASTYNLGGEGDYQPNYQFDDSIIVDKESQMAQDLQMVTRQIMGKVEFRMRNFNEDEETAKEQVQKAMAENDSFFGEGAEEGEVIL